MYNKTLVDFSPVQSESENPQRQNQGMQTMPHRPIIAHLYCLFSLLQTFRQFLLILEHIPNSGSHDPVPSFWKTLCMVFYFSFLKLCTYIISSAEIQLYYFHLLTGEQVRKQGGPCIIDESQDFSFLRVQPRNQSSLECFALGPDKISNQNSSSLTVGSSHFS